MRDYRAGKRRRVSPIGLRFDRLDSRCIISGVPSCDCWQTCSCGRSYEKGKGCYNPVRGLPRSGHRGQSVAPGESTRSVSLTNARFGPHGEWYGGPVSSWKGNQMSPQRAGF
jgi:hypothetical protein